MERRVLGKTGLSVSRLAFGTLSVSPIQSQMTAAEGARVLSHAIEKGVNLIDTAELYGAYPLIAKALEHCPDDVVLCSKSYAYTSGGMKKSLEKALRTLQRDCIDIFMLHEQDSPLTLEGHSEALDYLLDAKKQGKIKHVGVSTHSVAVADALSGYPEIEVIHPLYNFRGVGVLHGSGEEMLNCILRLHQQGKGIIGMKALAGGNLLHERDVAFAHVLGIDAFQSIAVGMRSVEEVEANVHIFSNQPVPVEIENELATISRRVHVDRWCNGCGACITRCHQNAMRIINGKAEVNHEQCVLCGYCSRACANFYIKII